MNSGNDTRPILIRADAGSEIGTGHIMRCIALAQACRESGIRVHFACAECPSFLKGRIQNDGFEFHEIEANPASEADSDELLQLAKKMGCSWIALDGYPFDTSYQRKIRIAGIKLLVIDDYGHLDEYEADILLNQNISAKQAMYPRINDDCRLLLGTNYVLLRNEFLAWTDWQREIPVQATNVLVMMGGSDPSATMLNVVEALRNVSTDRLTVRFVVGGANPRLQEFTEAAEQLEVETEVIHNAQNMPELMAWADLAISAAGSTCWELMFMRLPAFIVCAAENQQFNYRALIEQGLMEVLPLDSRPPKAAHLLESLIHDYCRRQKLASESRQYIDGKGGSRVASAILRKSLSIRLATPEDCQRLWEWANDPVTRSMSFNNNLIPREDHEAWFLKQLNDSDKYLFIGEWKETPCGVVRFDVVDGDRAVISINLAPEFRGFQLAVPFLRKGLQALYAERPFLTVDAYIKPENHASIRAFEKAGFQQKSTATWKNQTAEHYIRQRHNSHHHKT